jgi:hypothetical protein
MSTDTKLRFSLGYDLTNDHFSLTDGDTIEVTYVIIKIYSFTNYNRYEPLPDVDLYHVYFHWHLDSIAYGHITKINKEYQLDSMKLGKNNTGVNSSFQIWLCNDGHTGIHIWLKRLLLEYVMLY